MAAVDHLNRDQFQDDDEDDFDLALAKHRRAAGLPVGRAGRHETTENREGEWPTKQGMWR